MKKTILLISLSIGLISCNCDCPSVKNGTKVYKYRRGDVVNIGGIPYTIQWVGTFDECDDLNDKTYGCESLTGDNSHTFSEQAIDEASQNQPTQEKEITTQTDPTTQTDSTTY